MTGCSSYLLSLLSLLLITHWIHSASLRSSLRPSSKWSLDRRYPSVIIQTDLTTSEPVLSRRRPLLSPNERRKRWNKEVGDDEIEIPIDDELINESDDVSSTMTAEQLTITDTQLNAGVKYLSVPETLIELNQTDELTTLSTSENNRTEIENIVLSTIYNEIIDSNSTEVQISSQNATGINEIIESNSTEAQLLSQNATDTNELITSINETSSIVLPTNIDFKQDTAIILLDYTTLSPADTDDNQTLTDSVTQANSTEYTPTVSDHSIDNTTLFEVTQNETTFIQEGMNTTAINVDEIENVTTIITDQEIDNTTIPSEITLNETSTIIFDDIEYSNDNINITDRIETKPVCDQACQCLKECPYGFEIANDTCQCDPPCQSYQCFGNDTCTVSNSGQPICRPDNGTEHDRPSLCYQPRDAGYHDESLLYHNRWYYDPEQDQCHLFVYRGLGGNANNFQTLHQCHLECITCAPAPDPGACLARLPMWYYNHKTQECAQFDYSGCKGNENKFLRKQDCADTCVTRILNL